MGQACQGCPLNSSQEQQPFLLRSMPEGHCQYWHQEVHTDTQSGGPAEAQQGVPRAARASREEEGSAPSSREQKAPGPLSSPSSSQGAPFNPPQLWGNDQPLLRGDPGERGLCLHHCQHAVHALQIHNGGIKTERQKGLGAAPQPL